MADFNNLLGEIEEEVTFNPSGIANDPLNGTPQESNNNTGQQQQQQQVQNDTEYENDEENDNAEIPSALIEAERVRRLELNDSHAIQEDELTNPLTASGGGGSRGGTAAAWKNRRLDGSVEDNDNNDDDDEDGLLLDADYNKMRRLWIQELNAPELLPHDEETMSVLLNLLSGQEETLDELQDLAKGGSKGGGGSNVDPSLASLAASICKLDSDRLSFVLADNLRTRLHKLENYALHNRECLDRMSSNEVSLPILSISPPSLLSPLSSNDSIYIYIYIHTYVSLSKNLLVSDILPTTIWRIV